MRYRLASKLHGNCVINHDFSLQELFVKRGGVILENSKVIDVVPGPVVQIVTASQVHQAKRVVLVPGL